MKRSISCAALVLVSAHAMAADPCLDNYTSEGNALTGRTYKTWAIAPGVRPQEAFPRVYAFTAENGFTVMSANEEAGVISAVQSASHGKGKTVPLTVTLKEDGAGTRVAITYATSGGMFSPEDAIKRHFCLTVAAASSGPAAPGGAAPKAAATPTPASPPQASRPALKGFAPATPEQQQAIKRELSKSIPDAKVRSLVGEASSAISTFVERMACLADYTGASALDEYAAPGVQLGSMYISLRPMRSAQYHNKAACMTVSRIHGWMAPANNALQFEVIYKADDSGETAKLTHEAVKQPDGTWLFAR